MCDCTSSTPPGFLPRAAEANEEALERLKEAFQAAATLASEPPKCKLNPEAVDFNPIVNVDMTASTFAGTWSDSRGNTIYVDFYMDRHGSTKIQAVLSNVDRKDIYLKIWWSPESSNWHCGNGKLDAASCSANQLVWQFANGATSTWSKQDVALKSELVFFDQVCPTSWSLSPAALILDNYDDLDSDSDSDDSVTEASAPFTKKSSFSSASSTTVNSEDDPASESDESVSWVIAARDLVAVPSSLDGIRPPPGLEQPGS